MRRREFLGVLGGAAMACPLTSRPALAQAQQRLDSRIADLVQSGKVRIALHLPQFVRDPATGQIRGYGTGMVLVPIAAALGLRLGLEVELVGTPSPPALVECLKAGACDVGFLGMSRARAAEVDFAPPHVTVPFTYLVPAGSPIRSFADADKPGIRIAAVRNHASTVALASIVKHATLVYAATPEPDPTFDLLRTGQADVFASTRGALQEYAARLPGSRVLEGQYGANLQALAVPKEQSGRLAYIREFIEEVKASGLVQSAIDRAGLREMQVAPPGEPVR